MVFYNIEYLQFLLGIPFLVLIYIIRYFIRRREIRKIFGAHSAFLRSSISDTKRMIKVFLSFFVLALLIIALARPQAEGEKQIVDNKGIYMLLLIDASLSMLAEDVKPNRLSFMKKEISKLIDLSTGDKIALAIFAHTAVLSAPFTSDLSAIKSYLNDISTDYLSHQGTNFERAFRLAAQVFSKLKKNEKNMFVKAIVIASDGEDHSKQTKKIIQDLITKNGIRVFTISFGTQEGGVIPIKDYKGQIKEYKKDIKGEVVLTRLKKEGLKKFAKWGKGAYYHASYGGRASLQLRQDLNRLEKTLFEQSAWIKKQEQYQWFLLLAFLIALTELILGDRSYKNIKKRVV